MKKIINRILPLALLMGIVYSSCTKYDNPPPVFEEFEPTVTTQRKVLVISIDGLAGSELKAIAPTNIEALRKTSKYSYDVLRGQVANDVASWATMITGVSYSKHLIRENTFQPTPKENSHDAPAVFRNSFDYVLQYKSVKTAMVTPWAELRNYVKVVDRAPVVTTDVAVKDSAINIINTITPLGTMIVNFRDVQAAGASGGFLATNATYKAAVVKADEYVGNIITALKARKNYVNEDWLIMVTTNHGGSNDDPKPGFLIASNKNLKEEEVKKSGFNTVNFKTDAIVAAVPDDHGLYSFGTDKDFSVQMQTKFMSANYYPQFLGKSTSNYTGWFWMQEGNQWNLEFGGTNNGGGGKQQLGIAAGLADGSWHTLTMTVKYVNSTTRTASAFVDGVFKSSYNVSASKNINTTELLKLGVVGGNSDFYAANLSIFNIALEPAVVTANIALKDITKHPNYANLIGFWPINEGGEGVISNKAPVGYDMYLSGPFSWPSMGTSLPAGNIPDPNAGGKSIILTPAAVSATMLYWMNIKILPVFGIDGNPFLNQFEIEFLK
ncbi:alkaline phosphatase family protein [Pedobacter insulae]|uniref:Concanavalin A-like lectin/glucanases superfamily protein n=1 Tax=Pedobacter insulae TaxID=414048 RepID=A0A1I2WJB2_9SPHI|nr:alkaline phosphatase family protein [Pedobacter insulae]SFH00416.1 Concanavalin A-like lectin/glucanases superfamily protein [Pedobacter insulae]